MRTGLIRLLPAVLCLTILPFRAQAGAVGRSAVAPPPADTPASLEAAERRMGGGSSVSWGGLPAEPLPTPKPIPYVRHAADVPVASPAPPPPRYAPSLAHEVALTAPAAPAACRPWGLLAFLGGIAVLGYLVLRRFGALLDARLRGYGLRID